MKFIAWLAFLCISLNSLSQSIKGKIIDEETKEGIPFCKVYFVDYAGVLTDEYGDFVLNGSFPERLLLRVSASGYETVEAYVFTSELILVELSRAHHDLKEVVVVSSSNEMKRNEISYIELKSIGELNEIPKVSIGQMLDQIPGVYNSSTGVGISKPVIRGLQGVRVLTLLNGVRLEGQQWGGDHGMGVSELGIGSIEILKGPASLAYGADALGGIIYLGNQAYSSQGKHQLALSSQYESATNGNVSSVLYNGTTKNFKVLAGARFASHADYQLPSGDFVKNARFQDVNGKVALGWHKNKWVGNLRYDFSMSTIGIPGHTHDSVAVTSDFISSTHTRKKSLPVQYLDNHILSWQNKWILNKMDIQLLTGLTYNHLVEHDEKVTIPGLDLSTYNLPYKLQINHRVTSEVSFNYGLQGMALSQQNGNNAEDRLVPDAKQLDNGIYFITTWSRDKWKVLAGVRGDIRVLHATKDVKFLEDFRANYAGINFSAGTSYKPKNGTILRLNVTSGFRTPHLSELLSEGVHHGSFRYEVGDRNLKNEQALQIDFSYERIGEHLSLILNPFVNFIQDFIYLEAQNNFVGSIQQFNYKQANNAVTQVGMDLGVHWHPHFAHIVHLESTVSYLKTYSRTSDAISLVPQPRWTNALIARFEMKSKFRIDNAVLQYMYYLPQKDVSAFETPSVDYGVLDLGMQMTWNMKSPLMIQLGVKNITNQSYISHLSRLKTLGLPDVGRSFYVKLVYNLNLN